MRTVLFGGSFDPVHNGHVSAVKALASDRKISADRIIVMPAFISPFKPDGGHVCAQDRLAMCSLAFSDIPCCSVSDMEIYSGSVSYTVDTLRRLHGLYPEDKLFLAVGSDSLNTLPQWRLYSEIISLADIAAFSRSESDRAGIAAAAERISLDGGKVITLDTVPVEISSTSIRKKIFNNEDISCYLPEKVVEYIMYKNLYKGQCADEL